MYGVRSTYIGTIILLASVLCVFTLSAPCPSEGSPEKLIVNITVNSADKGEYLVHLDTNEDFLLRPDDLTGMGINTPAGKTVIIDGEAYQSLRSLSGITHTFDRKSLILHITSEPSLLPRTVIDLSPPSNLTVHYPRETSAFLNYGIAYNRNDITDSRSVTVANKFGMRSGDVLFLTDSLYTKGPEDSEFVRLMSNMTYEWRGDLQWLVVGDSFASSGDMGSTVNMGGISFTKVYRLDPYFFRQPLFNFSGVATLPSEASVYLDGMLIRKEQLAPGQFELNNLHYYGGSRLVEVFVKDAFGNEQRVAHPFYFTDALLKKGLHEYSYHAGFLREQFGVLSNEYGDPAFSAFHHYGINDAVTVGVRAEATKGLFNIGPQAAFRLLNAGVVLLSLAGSKNDNKDRGYAASFNHTYQYRKIATRLQYKKYSDNYSTIQSRLLAVLPRWEKGAGVSYSFGTGSALSVDYLSARVSNGTGRDSVSGTYSSTITNNLTGFVTLRRSEEVTAGSAVEFLFGINMAFGGNTYGSFQNRVSKGTRDNMINVHKNITGGEGLSYRGTYQSQDSDAFRSDTLNPYAQYNGRYGIYSADYSYQRVNEQAYNNYALSTSGALVYTPGFIGLTRPVNDSFSVVKVDGLEGVKVKMADMDMGMTDSSGSLIIPEIRSYNYTQVSIDPSDIPIDYQLSNVSAYISPSQWSGSCIVVGAKKIQAYTGRLLVAGSDGARQPAEMRELAMVVKDRTVRFPTGRGGEFYFDNSIAAGEKEQKSGIRGCEALSGKDVATGPMVTPGTYPASFDHEGRTCTVLLKIEKSDDVIVDLGEAVGQCEGTVPTLPKGTAERLTPAPAIATQPVAGQDPQLITVLLKADIGPKGIAATNTDRKALANLAGHLRKHPELSVEILTNDPYGTETAKNRLGIKRTEAIKRYLVALGVMPDRIKKAEGTAGRPAACDETTGICGRTQGVAEIRVVRDNQTTSHADGARQ